MLKRRERKSSRRAAGRWLAIWLLLAPCGSAGAAPMPDDPAAAANSAWWHRIGLDAVAAPAASEFAVAIVDTAVDLQHEDLAAIPRRESFRVRATGCSGSDCCDAQAGSPDRFHGTAVAGLIAATRGNGVGVAGIGTAGRLLAIDVFGVESAAGSRIAAGMECATAKGARLINVSFQGKSEADAGALELALTRAADANALVVLAAGNGISDLDREPEWPAAIRARTALTVTAVDLQDRLTGQRFGLKSVDLASPATDRGVCTTFAGKEPERPPGDRDCGSTATGSYGRFGQSSAAAAMVSGAALLLWGHPNYRDCSAEQVRALLLKHARTPEDATTRAALSPFGGVLDVHFLADVVRRDGRVIDLCSGALR